VLEDVPFGLLPTVLLGRLAGVPATLHASGIAILSAAYGRDFAQENDVLRALDIESLTLAQLLQYARDGYGAQ